MALWGSRAPQRKLDCHTGTSIAGVKECLKEQVLFSVFVSDSNQEALSFCLRESLSRSLSSPLGAEYGTSLGPLCQVLPDLYDLGLDTYMISLILSHYLKAKRKPSGLFMGSQLLAGASSLSFGLPLLILDSLSLSPSLLRKKGHW